MSNQKSFNTARDIHALSILICILAFLLIPLYWCYIFILFLSDGFLPSNLGLYLLSKLNFDDKGWFIRPDSWFGLHKIVIFFLEILGPGFFLFLASLLIWLMVFGVYFDEKSRLEKSMS